MLKIRDLGINVIPTMAMANCTDTKCVDPNETTACADVTCIKPTKQTPALKKPTKKPTKRYRAAGFSGDAVEQLKRQLEEQLSN